MWYYRFVNYQPPFNPVERKEPPHMPFSAQLRCAGDAPVLSRVGKLVLPTVHMQWFALLLVLPQSPSSPSTSTPNPRVFVSLSRSQVERAHAARVSFPCALSHISQIPYHSRLRPSTIIALLCTSLIRKNSHVAHPTLDTLARSVRAPDLRGLVLEDGCASITRSVSMQTACDVQ